MCEAISTPDFLPGACCRRPLRYTCINTQDNTTPSQFVFLFKPSVSATEFTRIDRSYVTREITHPLAPILFFRAIPPLVFIAWDSHARTHALTHSRLAQEKTGFRNTRSRGLCCYLDRFRTAVPCLGQISRIPSSLSRKQDCGSKPVIVIGLVLRYEYSSGRPPLLQFARTIISREKQALTGTSNKKVGCWETQLNSVYTSIHCYGGP